MDSEEDFAFDADMDFGDVDLNEVDRQFLETVESTPVATTNDTSNPAVTGEKAATQVVVVSVIPVTDDCESGGYDRHNFWLMVLLLVVFVVLVMIAIVMVVKGRRQRQAYAMVGYM
jgi:hypothetical protein